ncbi:MAG: glycosyltransferase family 2 protein [Myxococcota bacterium]|nr:glycosyltransferase family 2 protein [Myxococcota bacterium]
MIVDVIIPALNEAESIGHVLEGLMSIESKPFRRIIVVDNGSTDETASLARAGGACVVNEGRRGYGQACLTGLAALADDPPEVVLFVDGDGADDPRDIPLVLAPILAGTAAFVVGSRTRGPIEPGALTFVQHFGNLLSCRLVHLFFGVQFTDLGPLRAIRWSSLQALDMQDTNFGWTVEMQVKAARRGVSSTEVPVRCRRRYAGESKVSGTVKGSIKAGVKILYTIAREALHR